MEFKIEVTTKAVKDLKSFSLDVQKIILEETIKLENEPFSFKKKIKKIKGVKFPCFRLRIDLRDGSFRLFYGIEKNIIFILRIVSKKDAEKILKNIKKINFPPETQQYPKRLTGSQEVRGSSPRSFTFRTLMK